MRTERGPHLALERRAAGRDRERIDGVQVAREIRLQRLSHGQRGSSGRERCRAFPVVLHEPPVHARFEIVPVERAERSRGRPSRKSMVPMGVVIWSRVKTSLVVDMAVRSFLLLTA